jgi:hypothetical protein
MPINPPKIMFPKYLAFEVTAFGIERDGAGGGLDRDDRTSGLGDRRLGAGWLGVDADGPVAAVNDRGATAGNEACRKQDDD